MDRSQLAELIGTWRWEHLVDDPDLRRLESESWQFWPSPAEPGALVGRYLRQVVVQSATEPFACNGAHRYEQRATFELVARPRRGWVEIVETDYRPQPSPCDHGFRRLGGYRAHVARGRARLALDDGEQVLWQIDASLPAPPQAPWPDDAGPFAGPWRWSNVALDEQGLWRREEEQWSFMGEGAVVEPSALRDGATFSARYVRRVTVSTPDGRELSCAGAPSFGFEDRVTLEGARRDGILLLRELAIAAGEHPCLREHPIRVLDTATFEVAGTSLDLEWRGKRRQVLRR